MKSHLSLWQLAAVLLHVSLAASQSATSPPPAIVPAGTRPPGPRDGLNGALRPQVHFSPPSGFMNDPNGLHRGADGTYHLYYQYNPTALVAGNQRMLQDESMLTFVDWGHATSPDLYHWTHQAIALAPANPKSLIFSGSAIVDANNTSGFFPGHDGSGVVAIYTVDSTEGVPRQTQNLAYSRDGGYTFELYSGNPVLDVGSIDFRDPHVLWFEDHWVVVVAFAADYAVGFYTSPNLKEWTFASNFSHGGLLGLEYECPNLVKVPVEDSTESLWVLYLSINPGAPLGGSTAQYFIGNFNGVLFEPLDRAARLADFGKDNYAGQFFSGLPAGSPPISIAWASNWQYTNVVPTGEHNGFRGSMTVPRQHSLKKLAHRDWVLTSRPAALHSVFDSELLNQPIHNGAVSVSFGHVASNALYFEASLTASGPGSSLNFTFSSPVTGEYLQLGVFFGPAQAMWVNRGGLRGFDNIFFTDKFSVNTVAGITSISGILDRSVLEVFGNSGQLSATATFFPTSPLTQLVVAVGGLQPNSCSSIAVRALKSTWQ